MVRPLWQPILAIALVLAAGCAEPAASPAESPDALGDPRAPWEQTPTPKQEPAPKPAANQTPASPANAARPDPVVFSGFLPLPTVWGASASVCQGYGETRDVPGTWQAFTFNASHDDWFFSVDSPYFYVTFVPSRNFPTALGLVPPGSTGAIVCNVGSQEQAFNLILTPPPVPEQPRSSLVRFQGYTTGTGAPSTPFTHPLPSTFEVPANATHLEILLRIDVGEGSAGEGAVWITSPGGTEVFRSAAWRGVGAAGVGAGAIQHGPYLQLIDAEPGTYTIGSRVTGVQHLRFAVVATIAEGSA